MQIKNVLVPVDQSELAEQAIDYAVTLVQQQGSVTLLTVIEKAMPAIKKQVHEGGGLEDGFAVLATTMLPVESAEADYAWQNANHYLNRIAAPLERRGLKVNKEIIEGQPAESILDVAKAHKVDVIVMSTHGRTGLSRLFMGSVAQKVVAEATCPVFLVPQRALEQR